VLELEVKDGIGRVGELRFPAPGQPDGQRLRIGFRPYAVQVSPDLTQFPYQATLRHTFFLGVMLRVELELDSGLTLRSRMTKEEYAQLGLHDGKRVAVQIRNYRLLAQETAPLAPELGSLESPPPDIGSGI
jgi:hypothetical protein